MSCGRLLISIEVSFVFAFEEFRCDKVYGHMLRLYQKIHARVHPGKSKQEVEQGNDSDGKNKFLQVQSQFFQGLTNVVLDGLLRKV